MRQATCQLFREAHSKSRAHILMNKIKIKTGDWVVVCDGRKALILENVGDHAFPVLHAKEVREHPDLSTSEQGSDGPGRVHQSMGRARLTKGETRALIVVASPRALGVIREAYSPPCATPSTPNSPRIS
jgi:protein required for attachment to host cells